jgi:iron complex outermembrane recepter protein
VPVGNVTLSAIFNAAKAKSSGFEAELEWRASKEFTLGATLSVLDAKYTSFPDVALPFGTSILVADPTVLTPQTDGNGIVIAPAGQRRLFAPGFSCGVVPGTGGTGQPAAAFGCDLSNKRLPYSPEYQGTVSARYEFSMPGGGRLTPLLVATFSDGFFGQPTNVSAERQDSHVKGDFKLNWDINDNFTVQAFVDNITDEETFSRFVWGGGGSLQVSASPPRTYGIKLAYRNF